MCLPRLPFFSKFFRDDTSDDENTSAVTYEAKPLTSGHLENRIKKFYSRLCNHKLGMPG